MRTRDRLWKTILLAMLALLAASALVAGCVPEESSSEGPQDPPASETQTEAAATPEEPASESAGTYDWTEVELTDVESGETFTIADFQGQQVLMQAFAVW